MFMLINEVSLKYCKKKIVKIASISSKWHTVYTTVFAKLLQSQTLPFALLFFSMITLLLLFQLQKANWKLAKEQSISTE